ncbi:MAG: ribonuclease D, partial [Pseudomonadota bacterium]
MANHLHQHDLPADLDFGDAVAVDSETLGLNTQRDRLCVVHLSAGDGDAHLVQIAKGQRDAPNLVKLLGDPSVTKIFHYARFDLAALFHHLGVMA